MTKRKSKAKPDIDIEIEETVEKPLRIPAKTKALAATFFAGQRREYFTRPKLGFTKPPKDVLARDIKLRTKLENEVMHLCNTQQNVETTFRANVNINVDKKYPHQATVTLVVAWKEDEKTPEFWSVIITARGVEGSFDCVFDNTEEALAYILACDDYNLGNASASINDHMYGVGEEAGLIWLIIDTLDKQGLLV